MQASIIVRILPLLKVYFLAFEIHVVKSVLNEL